jgi:glycine cleavage system H protein
MKVPEGLLYNKEHEWIRVEDGKGTIGITDYAQDQLGDLVFVELPQIGDSFEAESELASLESVKAVSEVYCPVSGEILEVNEQLLDAPELINDAPYTDGWIVVISIGDTSQLDALLSAEAYSRYVEEESS